MSDPDPGAARRKLLFVLPTLNLAGAQTVVVELARGLDPREYDVSVCCLLAFGSFEAELERRGVGLHLLRPAGFKDLRLPFRLAALIRELGVDLVASHFHPFDVHVAAAARLAGVPCVVTKHSTYRDDSFPRWLMRAVERTTQRLASAYVVVSRAVGDEMVAVRGVDPARVEVVYNGIDVAAFAADPEARRSARSELGLAADAVAIGTVANLHPRTKGYETLVEAMPKVLQAVPAAHFVWVGRDDLGLGAQLLRRAAALGVSGRLTLTGPRDDVPRLLAAFDAFVLPSSFEGLGIVLIEAMACGLPVVASDVGGIPEVVADGETGLLAPVGDSDAFAAAIGTLLSDRSRATEMGTAGRSRARERFGVAAMIAAYRKLFARVLPGRGPGRHPEDAG